MADFGQSIRTYLIAQAGVSSLIGTGMYPHRLPQGAALPAITFAVVSSRHEHHQTAGAGLVEVRLQLDCLANTYIAARALAEAVRAELQGYNGAAGTDTVRRAHLDFTVEDFDSPADASDSPRFRIIQDWLIAGPESVPTF